MAAGGGMWSISRTDANARGERPALRRIRGLDGIRALAVLSIIAFHSGLSSLPGGFYGVDAFFVLSGFLITSLLVREWGETGTIFLRGFWARRARRLLPALFLLVAFVGFVMAAFPQSLSTPHALAAALATVFDVSNWYSLHTAAPYFDLSSQPSPLLHTWSLAIEEQFYFVWPLVLLGVLTAGTARRQPAGARWARLRRVAGVPLARAATWTKRRRLLVLLVLACVGALVSASLMAYYAPHGYTARAYYGTDTRAQAILVGAAIAIGLTLWEEGSRRAWFASFASVLAVAGVIGAGVMWATTSQDSTFSFRGGFLVASVAAGAVVLGCAVAPRSVVVRLLELPPLPQMGRISYGVYLWYWPVLLLTSAQRLHWGVYPLFVFRVVVTTGIALLSYKLVEVPIQHGALRRLRLRVVVPSGAAFAVGAMLVSTLVPTGATVLVGAQLHAPGAGRSASEHLVATDAETVTAGDPSGVAATSPPATSSTAGSAPAGSSSTSSSTSSSASSSASSSPPSSASGPGDDAYLSPAPPGVSLSTHKPVKVLLVGDSVAGTLGVGLAEEAKQYGVQLVNEGTPGCSLSMQSEFRALYYTVAPDPPCDTNGEPDSLLATWRQWVDAYNPDVVLYVGRGETYDQLVWGQWQNLTEPGFNQYVADRFRQAISVLGSRGASVVLMTTPYYDSGMSPSGTPWPEDNPSRASIDNATIRAVSSAAPPGVGGRVYVFDLNALVSPGGRFSPTVDSINVRCADGVHFSESGGIFVGQRLAPELSQLGQAHASSSPGGAWVGALPPSTPSWYSRLPCQ